MATIELKVPDIGGSAEIIELLAKVGDSIALNQGLLTLESDKASMEVPATHAGILKQWQVKVGDKVDEGDVIAVLDVVETLGAPLAAPESKTAPVVATQSVGAPLAAPESKPTP